uniref:Uncharacterized protein n=1 Tax=Esox lucius TaxID=8010 RepID=A0A6Q2Z109_ESOLU
MWESEMEHSFSKSKSSTLLETKVGTVATSPVLGRTANFHRDDYDKQVKQASERQRARHTTTPRRPRRPDIQVYHPRRGNGSEPGGGAENEEWNESGSSTEPETHGTELFWLDYQADSGRVTSFIVHKEDMPESVVERVAEENVLDPAMRVALQSRVRKEMDKRQDKC